jgi:hypothetical protein
VKTNTSELGLITLKGSRKRLDDHMLHFVIECLRSVLSKEKR